MRIIYKFDVNMRTDYENEKTSQKPTQIYSQRKSSDSTGSFGFERAGKINHSIISKIF